MLERILGFVDKHLLAVLAAVMLWRVLFLFVNGLDLLGDESYYWDWSRLPDWCYYSKPPMVAWLIGLASALGGDHTAVVRLPAVLLGTVGLGYFYATARAFYGPKAGALAVLLLLATPFDVLINFVMTIDAPLSCFWIMALYYLQQALFKQRLSAWFWAGLSTAAALLSKQVALLLPLLLVVFLVLDKPRRGLFKREFWLFLLPVALALLPILVWNQQHDWVMYGHSKGHLLVKETATAATRMTQAGSFVLYQLLLVSPVLWGLVLAVGGKACWRFFRLSPSEQFLVLTGPVLVFAVLVLGAVQKVQGNWPIPFYFSALILLSGWCLAEQRQRQKSARVGLAAGFGMVALTYALPVLIQVFHLNNTVVDPTYRFRHWSELAASINSARPRPSPRGFVLTLGHRNLASQLAFYLPDHPKVYRYEPTGQIVSQYEVWGWPESLVGKTAFIVSEHEAAEIPSELKAAFREFKPLGSVANPMQSNGRYYLFSAENLLAVPKPKVLE